MRRSTFTLLLISACASAGVARANTNLFAQISVQLPAGWDAHIVARTTPGAAVPGALATAPSLAPTSPVWLNWSVHANAAVGGYWTDQLLLDGVPVQVLPRWNGTFAARDWHALDAGPVFVHGGRHTLTAWTDQANLLEDYEFQGDNRLDRQLIWTPEALAMGATAWSPLGPPVAKLQPWLPANNHAFSFTPGSEAWVAAMRPVADHDLVLYDDYASSSQGLVNELARSARTADSVDVVVGVPSGAPAPLYPAVERKPATGEGSYVVQWRDTEGRIDLDGDAYWSAESLLAGDLAKPYAVDLQGGQTYPISVWRRVGSVPIHFAVLPGHADFVGTLDDALVRSQPVPGQEYEVATFTPGSTGRFLLVVFREGGEPLARYQLAVGSAAVGVEPGEAGDAWLEASPNPSNGPARLHYSLAHGERVRLDVLDVQGRRVRTLFEGERPAGTYVTAWDLRDDAGGAVPPGLYWARIDVGGRERRARLAVIH